MLARANRFLHDDLGASLVEYALIISLIAITCLFGLSVVGTHAKAALSAAAATSSAANDSGDKGDSGQGGGNTNPGGGHGGHRGG